MLYKDLNESTTFKLRGRTYKIDPMKDKLLKDISNYLIDAASQISLKQIGEVDNDSINDFMSDAIEIAMQQIKPQIEKLLK